MSPDGRIWNFTSQLYFQYAHTLLDSCDEFFLITFKSQTDFISVRKDDNGVDTTERYDKYKNNNILLTQQDRASGTRYEDKEDDNQG